MHNPKNWLRVCNAARCFSLSADVGRLHLRRELRSFLLPLTVGRCEMTYKCVVLFILIMALAAGIPSRTPAQTAGTGVIVGTVTDPTGATVSGATVTLTDIATNAARTASTNQAGRYDFPNLPPGKYDLTINKSGFRQVKFSK